MKKLRKTPKKNQKIVRKKINKMERFLESAFHGLSRRFLEFAFGGLLVVAIASNYFSYNAGKRAERNNKNERIEAIISTYNKAISKSYDKGLKIGKSYERLYHSPKEIVREKENLIVRCVDGTEYILHYAGDEKWVRGELTPRSMPTTNPLQH